MEKLIRKLKNDDEINAIKKEWLEIGIQPWWGFNYDEFDSIDDYKCKLREKLEDMKKQKGLKQHCHIGKELITAQKIFAECFFAQISNKASIECIKNELPETYKIYSENLFKSKNRDFVKRVILVKDSDILYVLERK